MSGKLEWNRDGDGWPNRDFSQFIDVNGLRFHVQCLGDGDPALLVHGTGASTHSFSELATLLSKRFKVIVPDLPGHGFTDMPAYKDLTLPMMAKMLAGLLESLGARPVLAIGHSAGAAILIRMILNDLIAPRLLVSLNGAILPLHGVPGHIFAPLANLFIKSGFMSRFFAWRARHTGLVSNLMRQTGSTIPDTQLTHYETLARSSAHVDAAIGMMANWDLETLEPELVRLDTDVLLISGGNDRMIAPSQSLRLRRILPNAQLELLSDLGHLAHEEDPRTIDAIILDRWEKQSAKGASKVQNEH
ncbi:MAG: alpha/beta fold hydrolase BchO [Pseudomonadota bacterium]